MVKQLDPIDPFHPLIAAASGYDEAHRGAVLVAQRLSAEPSGEQQVPGVGEREPPAIPGHRPDAHVPGAGGDPGEVDHAAEPDAPPALRGVEAARAVEGGEELVRGGQVGQRECELTCNVALDPQTV